MPDTIPALRGHLGDWEYYVSVMKLVKLAKEVDFAHKLHPHAELDLQIQRELSRRAEPMTEYLLQQSERFYGALIVAVYGGNPKFQPVQMAEHPLLDDSFPFGVIILDGSQRYFALDGQHRLESIKRALEKKPELGSEEVSVIFVPHMQTPDGIRRTRRLFNTINRYAKPTSQSVNIIMDEDDLFALVTRRLLREHALFFPEERVKLKGANVPDKSEHTFTTLSVLYQVNEWLLRSKEQEKRYRAKGFKQFRPPEDDIDEAYEELFGIWNAIIDSIPDLRRIVDGSATPLDLRCTGDGEDPEKGHLLMRPVGQLAFAHGLRMVLNDGVPLEQAVARAARVPWQIGAAPWKNVVWHAGRRAMITTKEAQNLCARLIAYLLGGHEQAVTLAPDYAAAIEAPGTPLPPRVRD